MFQAGESSDEGDSGWSSCSGYTTSSSNSEIEDLELSIATGGRGGENHSRGSNGSSPLPSPPSSVSLVALYPQQSVLKDSTNIPVVTIATAADSICTVPSLQGTESAGDDHTEEDPIAEVSIISDVTTSADARCIKTTNDKNGKSSPLHQKTRAQKQKKVNRKKKATMPGYDDAEERPGEESDYEAETTEESSSSSFDKDDNDVANVAGGHPILSTSGGAATGGEGSESSYESSSKENMQKPSEASDDGTAGASNSGGASNDYRDSAFSASASSLLNGTSNHSAKSASQGGGVRRRSSVAIASTGLSWKSDPLNSFMDWTVHIVQKDTGKVDVHPVHRNMVGFGSRKSLLLCDHFQEQIRLRQDQLERHQRQLPMDYSDAERWIMNSTSRIIVPSIKYANAFPMVLDYLYHTRETKQALTAERACCVYFLARTLRIDGLAKAITDFYAKNLSLSNMGEFLNCAAQLVPANIDGSSDGDGSTQRGHSLLAVSKNKIGTLLTERPELAGLVPPHFLSDILDISKQFMEEKHKSDPQMYTSSWLKQQGQHWSKAVVACCVRHEESLTVDMFDKLTSDSILPTIDTSMAIQLLKLHKKFHPKAVSSDDISSKGNDLEGRCIDCITDNWHVFQGGFINSDAVSNALKDLPNDILALILVRSMNKGNNGGDRGTRSGGRSGRNGGSANSSTTSTEATSHGGEDE